MSPRIGLAASLSSSPTKLGAVAPPPPPTDYTMVLYNFTPGGSVSNEILFRLSVNDATTNAIIKQGNTIAAGNRMNGTVTVTVEDTVALTSGTVEAYIYFEVDASGTLTSYLLSTTASTNVTAYDLEALFDLSTFSTNMAPATGEINLNLVASVHINTFASTITVSGTEYQPNQSAESADKTMVIIGA